MNRGHVLGLGLLLMTGGLPVAWANPQVPAGFAGRRNRGRGVAARRSGPGCFSMPWTTMTPRGKPARQPARQAADRGPAPRGVPLAAQGPRARSTSRRPRRPRSSSGRPSIRPSANAQWIEGYWEWDAGRKDFVWVTGTWRVPPPGRFWVNGYWKRDEQGWYRVPGFWSDRKTDRLDYRKNGPPADRPDDEPGEPPAADCFYIPGQYYPDGDGVVWKKGFWAKVQPGWAWVPAQWVRQPEGWVFQDGYWDRTLEDRGTLFAPAAGRQRPPSPSRT